MLFLALNHFLSNQFYPISFNEFYKSIKTISVSFDLNQNKSLFDEQCRPKRALREEAGEVPRRRRERTTTTVLKEVNENSVLLVYGGLTKVWKPTKPIALEKGTSRVCFPASSKVVTAPQPTTAICYVISVCCILDKRCRRR